MLGSDTEVTHVVFTGGKGNDTLTTGAKSDVASSLTGGDGSDTFTIENTGAGVAKILDLSGTDIFTVSSGSAGVAATVTADFVATSSTANNKALANAVLTASQGIDIDMTSAGGLFGYTINGGSLDASTLKGGTKNDIITGGAGADSVVGSTGNDTLQGKAGSDTVEGGLGDDVIKVATGESVDGDSVDGGSGTDKIDVSNGTVAWSGEFDFDDISNLLKLETSGAGGAGANTTITISAIADTSDQVITIDASSMTQATSDLVVTNSSARATTDFSITGATGLDTIAGGLGDDTIIGSGGADQMTSAAGADVFSYTAASQTYTATSVTDTIDNKVDNIVDFTRGSDKIAFGKIGSGGSSMSFGGNGVVLNVDYEAGKVYVVETGETAVANVDGATAGANGGANKVALVIYNPTAADIDMSGEINSGAASLEAAGANGLVVFALANQSGVDYADMAASDFTFA
jgi:Ca2+-binding RTX toxin-like protein